MESNKVPKHPQKRNVAIKDLSGYWCRSDKHKAYALKAFLEDTFTLFSFCKFSDAEEICDFRDVPFQMDRPIKPFTVRDVIKEIQNLNSKKAPGFDLLDAVVAMSLPKKGYINLTLLFNSILRLSHFPKQWK